MTSTQHTTALARLENLDRRFTRIAVEHRKAGERDQAQAADKIACVARYCLADLLASVESYQRVKGIPRKLRRAAELPTHGPVT